MRLNRVFLVALLTCVMLAACGGGQGSPSTDEPSPGGPGSGGGSSGGGSSSGKPGATAVGRSLGLASTARIGPAGGTLVSGDGQAALEVPAGALSAETELSMAPITNEAPGGHVGAWRFGPDGLTFAKPAVLRLRGMTPDEAGLARLATQRASRVWQAAGEPLAASGEELAFSVPHFSDWGFYERFNLSPALYELRPGGQVALRATRRDCPASDPDCEIEITPLTGNADVVRWTVNGVLGGNAAVGTLSKASGPDVVYTAPAQPPAGNPVAIAAHIVDPNGGQIQLVSHVKVLPPGVQWSGQIRVRFFGLRVDNDGDIQGRHQVMFDATHHVTDVIADAPGDDGAVTASFVMSAPVIDYRYQYGYKQPGYETLAELASRRAAVGYYDGGVGFRPTLSVSADSAGRMQVPMGTLLAYMDVKGQRTISVHDGTTGQTTVERQAVDVPLQVGPELGSVPTGVFLRHPISGAPIGELPGTVEGQRLASPEEGWSGHTELEDVALVFEGHEIRGVLSVDWQFNRRPQ